MKTIWILGGMSWESTTEYYKIINKYTKEKLWWLHSAEILLHSVDFAKIEELQHRWDREWLTQVMIQNAQRLENGWADFVVIAINTMHKCADDISANINIPILHIADATADVINKRWIWKVLLLATKFTMEWDFYISKLNQKWIDVVVPNDEDRQVVHDIIYNELCLWIIKWESKQKYLDIISRYAGEVWWVILGCTEIWLLIWQEDLKIPVFDTTYIHAESALEYALR